MTQEQRRYRRYPIKLRVQFSHTDRVMEVSSRDISLGGVYLATSRPAIPGTVIKMTIHLPDNTQEIKVAGIVVHFLAGRGMGVEFKTFGQGAREALARYLETFE
jgi:hypothetical protein